MERALSLLTCGYDPARKNVALFFGASIHFRGILDVFDRVGGLPRLLDAMRTVLLLLRAPAHGENRSEKQAGPFPALSLWLSKISISPVQCILLAEEAECHWWQFLDSSRG